MFYLSDDLHLEPHTLTFQRTAYILTSDSGSSKKLKTSWFSRKDCIKERLFRIVREYGWTYKGGKLDGNE